MSKLAQDVQKVDLSEIRVGPRYRAALGDIEGLAASIADVGLLHPVVVTPKGTLIAGARRMMAMRSLGWTKVPVTVVDLEGIARGEYAENVQRKDFTAGEAHAIAEALKPYEQAAAKKRQAEGGKAAGRGRPKGGAKKAPPMAGKARTRVAKATGYSAATLAKIAEVKACGFPDLVAKIQTAERGEVTRIWREMKRHQKAAAVKRAAALPNTKYRVLLADPPWSYNDKCDDGSVQAGGAETHYESLSIAQICAFSVDVNGKKVRVRDVCEKDAVLWLWVTSPLLFEAKAVIDAWGFEYRASFVWDKVKHNVGHYNSVRHEFLLVCTRGSCTPDVVKLYDSVQSIERGRHSEKPREFRDIIDTLYPHGKRLELFARERVDGWDAYGDEAA